MLCADVAPNPPAKAEAPELAPKLLNREPELVALADVVPKGEEPGAAALPRAGKREVGGGGVPPNAVNGLLAEAAAGACAGAGAPNTEAPWENGELAVAAAGAVLELPPAPNKEVEPIEDAREPSPSDDDCALETGAAKMLAPVLGCEPGKVAALNALAEDAAAVAADAGAAEDAEEKRRAG